MKFCRVVPSFLRGSLFLLLVCAGVARAQVPCTIYVRSLEAGYYDVFGEHDVQEDTGITGVYVQDWARGPLRSFMAFSVPSFPGALLSASVDGYAQSQGPDDFQTLQLIQVTNSVDKVRRPSFFATDVYADLGTGIVYGAHTFPSGFSSVSVLLNANGRAAVAGARGTDFVMGGSQPVSFPPLESDFINFPYSHFSPLTLRLEISAPNEPVIYTQPSPSLLLSNDAVVTVGACGAAPLTYTWYVHGTNYSSFVDYPDLYLGYRNSSNAPVFVVVSNNFGSVTSSIVTVPHAPAQLRWQHTNIAVRTGSVIYESIQITSPGLFTTLTWLKNGMPYNNPNSSLLYLTDVQPPDSGDYSIVASNSSGVITSAVMRVDVVDVAPRFWEQPQNTTNAQGTYASLRVNAPAGPAASLRWYRDGVLVPNTNNAVLSFNSVTLSDTGNYYAVASNRAGVTTSAVARLEVTLDPPVLTLYPPSATTYPGRFVSFAVSISGSPYPDLQWYFNGSPIPGAVYSSLPLPNVSLADEGTYFCVASNISGVTTSQVATVTILTVPPVIDGPNDLTAGAGSFAYFSVVVSNPPACLQWLENGVPVPGAAYCTSVSSSEFYSNRGFLLGSSNYTAQISVVASNQFGFSTSRVASLTVTTAPPAFYSQIGNITVLEGSTVFIPNYAVGAPAPRLYLLRNGQDVDAFFGGNLRLFNVTPAQRGEYVVFASNAFGTATSAPFQINIQRVGPLDKWTRRHPSPQGNDLHALTFGQGRYVACGDVGTLITSTNATNWSVFSAEVPAELEGIAYGNGRFVAVGRYSGQAIVVTSTNSETWVTQTLPEVSQLRDVTFGDGKFLVVGSAFGLQTALVSSNASDWTPISVTSGNNSPFDVVAFGNGRFVIADDDGGANVSTDLVTWTNRFAGVPNPEGAAFVNGQFSIVGSGGRMTISADGQSWTSITNGATDRRLFATAFGAGTHVAVGVRGTIISSTSGNDLSWTLETSPTTDRFEDLVYANNLFVAVGENGSIVTSYDGHQWIEQTRGVAQDLDDIAVSDDLAIVVGKSGTILASTDGRAWAVAPLPEPLADSPRDWHGVAFGDGKIVVVGDSTNVLVSTDNAASWQPHGYLASASYLKSVIYTQGMWVAVGVGGVIVTSTDATNWSQRFSPIPFDLNDITYGNGYFVVVGDQFPNPNATILTSTNGIDWVNRSYPLGKNARAVTFQQGHFVIAANDGRFLVTTNPLAWGPVTYSYYSYDGANHRDVTAHDRIWISVGNTGIIVTSPSTFTNGISGWSARQSRTVENLHGVRHFKGAFLAVGNRGVILQSGPLESRLEIERDGNQLLLLFSTPHAGVYTLQESTDFSWGGSEPLNATLGVAEKILPREAPHKFFRVVPQ